MAHNGPCAGYRAAAPEADATGVRLWRRLIPTGGFHQIYLAPIGAVYVGVDLYFPVVVHRVFSYSAVIDIEELVLFGGNGRPGGAQVSVHVTRPVLEPVIIAHKIRWEAQGPNVAIRGRRIGHKHIDR